MLKETDAGFSETLLKLIDQTGKKDSEIYGKANVSRQHFSKIRNNMYDINAALFEFDQSLLGGRKSDEAVL